MEIIGAMILLPIVLIIQLSCVIFFAISIFIVTPVIIVRIYYWCIGNFEKMDKAIFKNDKNKYNYWMWGMYFIGLITLLIPVLFHNEEVIYFYENYLFKFVQYN